MSEFEDLFEYKDQQTPYLYGGSPGNPNGVSFTLNDARRWWEIVFAEGINISNVEPVLTPGSKVLSGEGITEARRLGRESKNFAPSDWNPLGLERIP